jgi:hypothetical protein
MFVFYYRRGLFFALLSFGANRFYLTVPVALVVAAKKVA